METYSKTPVLWYTRKTTSNDETKQDTTYVYTKGGMPLVVSYIEYKEAMERAAKHAQTEALYARELYELKKQLNDVLKAEKAKENAALKKRLNLHLKLMIVILAKKFIITKESRKLRMVLLALLPLRQKRRGEKAKHQKKRHGEKKKQHEKKKKQHGKKKKHGKRKKSMNVMLQKRKK